MIVVGSNFVLCVLMFMNFLVFKFELNLVFVIMILVKLCVVLVVKIEL